MCGLNVVQAAQHLGAQQQGAGTRSVCCLYVSAEAECIAEDPKLR